MVSKENPFLKAKNKIIEMSKNKDKNINKFQKDKINEIYYKYDNNPQRGFLYDNARILKKNILLLWKKI